MSLVKAIGNHSQIGRRTLVVRVQRIKGRLETLTRFPRRQLWSSVQQCRARGLSPGSLHELLGQLGRRLLQIHGAT